MAIVFHLLLAPLEVLAPTMRRIVKPWIFTPTFVNRAKGRLLVHMYNSFSEKSVSELENLGCVWSHKSGTFLF
jgi:hypothetical protein